MPHFSNVGRRLYGESPLSLLFGVSLHPGSPEQCCSIVLSFNTINLSATTGFIFPNDHSQQQQQRSRPRIYSDLQNPYLFFFCIIRIGNGNAGSGGGGYDYQRQQLLLAVPTVDQRLRRMGFISWFPDAPRDYRQYHNEYDDSNLADETGESLVNPLAQSWCPGSIQNWYNHFFVSPKLRESDSILTFLF